MPVASQRRRRGAADSWRLWVAVGAATALIGSLGATALQLPKDAIPGDVTFLRYIVAAKGALSGSESIARLVEEGYLAVDKIPVGEKQKRAALLEQLNTAAAARREQQAAAAASSAAPASDAPAAGSQPQPQQQQQGADATAAASAGEQAAPDKRQVWPVLDIDGDGVVPEAEFFTQLPDTEQNQLLFATEDKNGDGIITRAEFLSQPVAE